MQDTWAQRIGSYSLVKRRINKVKGWELVFYSKDLWGEQLGLFKTKKEVIIFCFNHKKNNTKDKL